MRSYIGVFGDVGWTSMRVVERKIKPLPDINQVCTSASAEYALGMYREKLYTG